MNTFDSEFTNLTDIAKVKAQEAYEAKMLFNISQNIRNDINNLDICIKDLRKNLEIGKSLYIQCTKSETLAAEEDQKLQLKEAEIQNKCNLLSSPNVKICDVEKKNHKLYDEIRNL